MTSRSNGVDEPAYPHNIRSLSSEAFRNAFLAVAAGIPESDEPSYTEAAKHHDKLRSKREFLFLNSQFGLPDAFHNPFPLYLPRPEFMEVPKESIEAIDPIIGGISARQIRFILSDFDLSASMFDATRKYTIIESNSKEMRIAMEIEDPSYVGPTHMLAVYGKMTSTLNTHMNFVMKHFPVHSIVLAANCAKLPPFPPPNEPVERASGIREFILPVVPIFPDSHMCFSLLLEYLYTKDVDILWTNLTGFPEVENGPCPHQLDALARVLADRPPLHLSQILGNVTMLWDNACCLGVYDYALWHWLDLIRQLALMAMAVRSGNADTLGCIKSAAAALDYEDDEPTEDMKVEEEEFLRQFYKEL